MDSACNDLNLAVVKRSVDQNVRPRFACVMMDGDEMVLCCLMHAVALEKARRENAAQCGDCKKRCYDQEQSTIWHIAQVEIARISTSRLTSLPAQPFENRVSSAGLAKEIARAAVR